MIELTPDPTPSPHVDVHLVAKPLEGTRLIEWTISRPAFTALSSPVVAKDDAGSISVKTSEEGARVRVTLERPPSGDLHVRYAVGGSAPAFPHPPPVAVDPDRFDGDGDSLLLVPVAIEDRPTTTSLRIDTHAIGAKQYVSAASTFGFGGERTVTASGAELRRATFIAGILGKAVFDTPEGHDEAVWLGYTAFDPRPASADMAGFRTAARQLLRTREDLPATMLFLTDARPNGSFVAVRRARSVVLRVGAGEMWSGPMRIAAASALLHEWIGDRLWVGPTDPAHEAEAYWFTEGVVRAVARDLLFRFGLITPAEDVSEVEGLAALLATSPLANESNASLAARAKDPGVTPLLVARGALYGSRIDALLRKKSGGKQTIEDVLAELYAEAAKTHAPLPATAWRDTVAARLGEDEATAFASIIERGGPLDVPDGALGPCFQRVPRTYTAFDLGFDKIATKASADRTIELLDPKGPAAHAGVAPGDKLVNVESSDGHADVTAVVTVTRNGGEKIFRYMPAGATGKGQGWSRRKEVADEACAR